MGELFSTGLPTPFNLEYFCLVDSAFEIEKKVHHVLDTFRVNENREFFSCDVNQIIDVIQAGYTIQGRLLKPALVIVNVAEE
jgi:molecular chaperone GrpE (heat shock protein)